MQVQAADCGMGRDHVTLLSAGMDGGLCAWSFKDNEFIKMAELEDAQEPILALQLDISSSTVVGGGLDGSLRVWKLQRGSLRRTTLVDIAECRLPSARPCSRNRALLSRHALGGPGGLRKRGMPSTSSRKSKCNEQEIHENRTPRVSRFRYTSGICVLTCKAVVRRQCRTSGLRLKD